MSPIDWKANVIKKKLCVALFPFSLKHKYALSNNCLTVWLDKLAIKLFSSYYLGQNIAGSSMILAVRGGHSREDNMGHKGKP